MKIEAGKRYITRGGQVVGPMVGIPEAKFDGDICCYRFGEAYTDGSTRIWRADGRYHADMETPMDLIAVVQPPQPAEPSIPDDLEHVEGFDPTAPGPSAFVRDAAVRILAGFASTGQMSKPQQAADFAVKAALALEKALQEAGQ